MALCRCSTPFITWYILQTYDLSISIMQIWSDFPNSREHSSSRITYHGTYFTTSAEANLKGCWKHLLQNNPRYKMSFWYSLLKIHKEFPAKTLLSITPVCLFQFTHNHSTRLIQFGITFDPQILEKLSIALHIVLLPLNLLQALLQPWAIIAHNFLLPLVPILYRKRSTCLALSR